MLVIQENQLIKSAKESNVKLLEQEIANGADINSVTPNGMNLLMYQIIFKQYYKTDYIEALIEKGINLDQKTIYGQTALHLASVKSDFYTVERLIKAGADINVLDKNKYNALMKACKSTSLFFTDEVRKLGISEQEEWYLRYICNSCYRDKESKNELLKDQLKIIKCLLENGINKEQISTDSYSAMDLAVENYHINSVEMVQILREHGVRLNRNCNLDSNRLQFDSLIQFVSDCRVKKLKTKKLKIANSK